MNTKNTEVSMNTKKTGMTSMNMQPLPGKTGIKPVLCVDMSAGHAAIAEAAEHRLYMLRSITMALACVSVESFNKHDQANLCDALNTLVQEAGALYDTAYCMACDGERAE